MFSSKAAQDALVIARVHDTWGLQSVYTNQNHESITSYRRLPTGIQHDRRRCQIRAAQPGCIQLRKSTPLTSLNSATSTKNTAGDLPVFCSITVRVTSTPTDARPKSSAPPPPDAPAPVAGPLSFVPAPVAGGGGDGGTGGIAVVSAAPAPAAMADGAMAAAIVGPRVAGGTNRQRASGSLPETGRRLSWPPSTLQRFFWLGGEGG